MEGGCHHGICTPYLYIINPCFSPIKSLVLPPRIVYIELGRLGLVGPFYYPSRA